MQYVLDMYIEMIHFQGNEEEQSYDNENKQEECDKNLHNDKIYNIGFVIFISSHRYE